MQKAEPSVKEGQSQSSCKVASHKELYHRKVSPSNTDSDRVAKIWVKTTRKRWVAPKSKRRLATVGTDKETYYTAPPPTGAPCCLTSLTALLISL